MSVFLPFVMQNLLNTPLAVSPAQADMIASALSGRLNIASLEDSTGVIRERSWMDRMALQGRLRADKHREMTASAQQADLENRYDKSYPQIGKIAVIQVWGTLTRTWGVGPYSGSTGYDGIQQQLIDAINDKTVEAVWLDINSGGGAVNGLFDLCEIIYSLNASHGGKPIYAMAADYAYSAAYAIATCADRVFCSRTGGVGSVGVIMMHAEITQALADEGIKVTIVRSPDRKARGSQFETLDQATLDHFQEQINETADIFAELVARNMGLDKKTVLETRGLDYMGERAKAKGFVDEVMSEPQAWHELETLIGTK